MVADGELPRAILQSLGRVFGGLRGGRADRAFRSASRWATCARVERNVDPLVESFRPIAAIAILPLAILWFGTGTAAAVFIVALRGVLSARRQHGRRRQARRSVAAAGRGDDGHHRAHRRCAPCVVPAALPSIGVGLRIAMGVAWTAIVAAELAVGAKAGGGGSGGIGQMMFVFYAYSIELNRIIVCMIAVGIVALALDRLLRACCALRLAHAVEPSKAMTRRDARLRIEHAGKRFPGAEAARRPSRSRTSRSTSRRASSS